MIYNNSVRNVPIACPRCGTMVRGKEETVREKGKQFTRCNWRCYRCGTFIKSGLLGGL